MDTEFCLSADRCMMHMGCHKEFIAATASFLHQHISGIGYEQAEVAELIYKLHAVFIYSYGYWHCIFTNIY